MLGERVAALNASLCRDDETASFSNNTRLRVIGSNSVDV